MGRDVDGVIGSLMYLLGMAASLAAFPLTILVILIAGNALSHDSSATGLPTGPITQAWAVSSGVTALGLVIGLRLLRGKRKLVLYLRRFGYEEATRAVTFAAVKTIGRSWRLVTLDDSEIAPVGVPTLTRRLFRAGAVGGASIGKVGRIVYSAVSRVIPITWAGMLVIVGILYLRDKDPHSVIESLRPGEPLGWDLHGLFWGLVGVMALALILGGLYVAVALLRFALLPVTIALHSSAASVREAEESKATVIGTFTDLETVARSVSKESRRIFAPRLVVLKVVTALWKQTVLRLASFASVLLIDVSEPSENLLWEMQELTDQFRPRWMIVGQYERVRGLAANPEQSPVPGSLEGRLSALLDGQEVLAYTTDPIGMKRFGRALRAKLQTASEPVPHVPGASHSPS